DLTAIGVPEHFCRNGAEKCPAGPPFSQSSLVECRNYTTLWGRCPAKSEDSANKSGECLPWGDVSRVERPNRPRPGWAAARIGSRTPLDVDVGLRSARGPDGEGAGDQKQQ